MTRLFLALLLGLVPGAHGMAQEIKLVKPAARLTHQFSTIGGVRELADGRVLVADGIDNVVLRADLSTQKVDTVGRSGQGPGEYKAPDGLFPLPDEATMVVDLGNARLSVFDGAGKYRESIPIAQGQPGRGGFALVLPRAVDAKGRIYYQPMGAGPRADSGVVVRWDRAAAKFDTIARVKLPPMITNESGGPNNRNVRQRPMPYPPQDLWIAAPDGRVALVRAPVYRVDWVSASGVRTVGKPIPVTLVPIRDPEKKEYLAEQAANGLSISMENVNGRISMRMSRGRATGEDDDSPDLTGAEWPAAKPAASGLLIAGLDGRIWVERSVPAGAARTYDIIGPDGAVSAKVTLPAGRRVVAIGARGVYARHVDPDGINYLERFDLR